MCDLPKEKKFVTYQPSDLEYSLKYGHYYILPVTTNHKFSLLNKSHYFITAGSDFLAHERV